MTALASTEGTVLLSRDEARSLTDEVKNDAERLWRKLVELYEGGAHSVLGYSSWGAYFKKEFGGSERRGYHLLEAGRVMNELAPVKNFSLPRNDHQARELAPLLDEPEKLRETWAEVVESNPKPTAADVRAAVQERQPVRPDPKQPIPTLKNAARDVIASAKRVGSHYEVPVAAMSALMLAAGERI